MSRVSTGPTATTNSDGNTQKKRGERVSSPASAAFLFGSLARHGTQVFEVSAQRLPDAGAEALGLDENGHQLLRSSTPARSARLCNASARRLPARISRFRTAKFFADLLVGRPKFLSHLERGLIEPEAGLDTDHHEVERAGEAPLGGAKTTPTIRKSAFSRMT